MMIKWNELTPEHRNLLVAQTVFNYQPVMCDVEGRDERYVQVYDSGETYCRKCHGRGNIGYTDGHPLAFEHQIVPPKLYTTDMNAAWEIVKQMNQDAIYSRRIQFWQFVQLVLSSRLNTNGLMVKGTIAAYPDLLWFLTAEDICIAALKKCGVEVG